MTIPTICPTGESKNTRHPLIKYHRFKYFFIFYFRRAEELNQQIEESRGELADYNMVLERLNTASSLSDLRTDYNNLKLHNDQETKSLDILFIEKGK